MRCEFPEKGGQMQQVKRIWQRIHRIVMMPADVMGIEAAVEQPACAHQPSSADNVS
jgi:hypothetical protein